MSQNNRKARRSSRRPSLSDTLSELIFKQQQQKEDQSPVTSPKMKRSPTFRGDYKVLLTSKERVYFAEKKVMEIMEENKDCDEEQSLIPVVAKFLQEERSRGLSRDECATLTLECFCKQTVAKNQIDAFRVFKSFWKTGLSYVDYTTDIMVFVQLAYSKKRVGLAIAQGVSIGVSLLLQCVVSLVFGQPWWVGLCGLLGLKPLIDGYRDAVGSKHFPKQKIGNDSILLITRMVELTVEAIPQSIIQTLVFILTPQEDRTSLQYYSIISSFLTIAITVALADKDMDTSKLRRKDEPLLYGYTAAARFTKKQLPAFVTCILSYTIAKTWSVSIFIASSPSALISVGWFVFEALGFLAWRMYHRSWRMYRAGADGAGFSLLIHLGCYLCLLAAPFPILRLPAIVTPRIYSGGLLYMLVSNFVMVATAYRVFGEGETTIQVSESEVWLGILNATLICAVSGGIFFYYVPASHRPTFYKHITFKEHLSTYHWNEKTHYVDASGHNVDSNEVVRAMMATDYSMVYLPKEKLIDFFEENWADWSADPPEWFDANYRAAVPRELLVKVPPMIWEKTEEGEVSSELGMDQGP